MNSKKLAKLIITTLKGKYPAPECALHHNNPWQLLVATILSAQCTDKRVNIVTPALFNKFTSIEAFAEASLDELENVIHSTGFFRSKAKNINACARALIEQHKGMVPQSLAELIKLPGVGRKTASVVLGTAFGKTEGLVVDTHVIRLAKRMGLTSQTDPVKIEQDLMQTVDKKHWIEFSHLLILHGRERCVARRPDCASCELQTICPKNI